VLWGITVESISVKVSCEGLVELTCAIGIPLQEEYRLILFICARLEASPITCIVSLFLVAVNEYHLMESAGILSVMQPLIGTAVRQVFCAWVIKTKKLKTISKSSFFINIDFERLR